jgi:predicted DNA-binding WGR domain protein
MPRYEYAFGTSNKFWEIELSGSKYSCKWGKIGGSVSMNSKDCGDAAAAKKAYDKLIAEKEKKGYQLVGGGKAAKSNGKAAAKPAKAAAPAGPARNPELEKAILANPTIPIRTSSTPTGYKGRAKFAAS